MSDKPPKVVQDALFPEGRELPPAAPPPSPLVQLAPIDANTSLVGLALPYRNYLMLHEHTTHTIDCFLSDLRLLTHFLGHDTVVGTIQRAQVVDWLMHLRWDSEAKPAKKTMARRVTFLKNFFGWLADTQVVPENIAAKITFARPQPPLPTLLFEDEQARLRSASEADSRCSLLIMLALDAGLKKEEILSLTTSLVDCSDPDHPQITVRLIGQGRPKRGRLLEMPTAFTAVYQQYIRRYQPQDVLFDCTDRNLTYILAGAVKRAGLTKRVTLQLLRDCFAVRQLQAGLPLAALREKLGLSDEAWYETQEKYRKLAFPV